MSRNMGIENTVKSAKSLLGTEVFRRKVDAAKVDLRFVLNQPDRKIDARTAVAQARARTKRQCIIKPHELSASIRLRSAGAATTLNGIIVKLESVIYYEALRQMLLNNEVLKMRGRWLALTVSKDASSTQGRKRFAPQPA